MKASVVLCMTISLVMGLGSPGLAREGDPGSSDPGFRPSCKRAREFVDSVTASSIEVFPTLIRTAQSTHYSTNSQQQIITFMNTNELSRAIENERVIILGEPCELSSYCLFKNNLSLIERQLDDGAIATDYGLVLELLVPPPERDDKRLMGIHCFVVNAQGQNVFSFLLDSNHVLFAEADLVANDCSEASRAALVQRATAVGMMAFMQQLREAGGL